MKHRGLKFLSLLLTLALLVGLLPGMTAFADAGTVVDDTVYLVGDTIKIDDGFRFYFAQWASGNDPEYEGEYQYRDNGTAPRVASATNAKVYLTDGGAKSSYVFDRKEAEGSNRKPIGVRIASKEHLPGTEDDQIAVVLKLVYGFTVTYDPGEGSRNNGVDKNPVHIIETNDTSYRYTVEPYDQRYFTAPDGKRFDHWENSAGGTAKNGVPIDVTKNITLTAIWVPDSKPSSGSGSGLADLVFNIPGVDNTWEYVGGGVPQRAYRVSLAPMQGGSAALGLTTGESGTALNVYPTSAVYVFPNADPGYTLDKIVWSLIDGSASYDITEAKNFVMPAMDVVVNVTFRPAG